MMQIKKNKFSVKLFKLFILCLIIKNINGMEEKQPEKRSPQERAIAFEEVVPSSQAKAIAQSEDPLNVTGLPLDLNSIIKEYLRSEWGLYKNFRGYKIENRISSLAISLDSKFLVAASFDKTIRIWNLKTGDLIHSLEDAHNLSINSIVISLDNKYIVSGSLDHTVKIWDFQTGKLINTIQEADKVWGVRTSGDNEFIIAYVNTFSGIKVNIRSLNTGKLIKTFQHNNSSLIITIDNQWLIYFDNNDFSIKIEDLKKGKLIKTLNDDGYSGKPVWISLDNKFLLSTTQNRIKIWNIDSGQCIRDIINEPNRIYVSGYINSAIISPDNKFIIAATECYDAPVKIWDFNTGKLIQVLFNHKRESRMDLVGVSFDGQYIIAKSDSGEMEIWKKLSYELGEPLDVKCNESKCVIL